MADIKGPMMRKGMTTMVGPIHFEDFDGANLERLVFAYLLRAESWDSVEWYGQVGSDSGRDIWASRRLVGEVLCVQCVNRGCLSLVKAKDDIGKVLAAHNGTPSVFRFVCRSSVSAKLKDAVREHALNNGIGHANFGAARSSRNTSVQRRRHCFSDLLMGRYFLTPLPRSSLLHPGWRPL